MIDPVGYPHPFHGTTHFREGTVPNRPDHGEDHHGADALDLRRLRYFIALAEEMHFGRAADRLKIAQPPLSRLIGRIEADLGAQLVDRSRSQIRLTQAGKVLLARAREIVRQVDEATAEVAQLGSGKSGILRIGFVGSATHGFLPSLIKMFRARYSDVELTLSAMNNAGLKEALIRREIDGAIARPAIEDDEILTEKLHEEPLIVALPDAFEREWRQPLPLASLRDAPFTLYPQHPRPSFADHILSVCSAAGFRPHKPVMAMDYQTAISLVSVGVGVCIVPRSVSATQHAGVIYRDFLGPNPGTSLSVNYRTDNRSPQLLAFISVARECARSLTGPSLRLAADRPVGPAAQPATRRMLRSLK
jgi:LysR family transcriptional regulator, benzoate and cis,cis-muconate-responsive activator of ben and cat genes